jgi:hypothetical protein
LRNQASEGVRPMTVTHAIYLEIGSKKVFAAAIDWPGWCRSGKDEPSAVRALIDAAPRYAKIARSAGLEFTVPETGLRIDVTARQEGNATTDFGAPDARLPRDWDPVGADELERYVKLLNACWHAFDEAVEHAAGKELRKGPRGGGRDLGKIVDHVAGAEDAYLRRLGWEPRSAESQETEDRTRMARAEVLRGLELSVAGQLPAEGPRGGQRWPPRYFVRRLAWHAVDHAWEIEDRAT